MSETEERSSASEEKYLTIRIPLDLHAQLVLLADKNDRTLSAEVRRAIRQHVDKQS